jgi:integrase
VEAVIPRIDEPFRQLAELSLLTSMRIGEMLGLEAGDLEGRTLRIERTMYKSGRIGPPKTESSRRGVKLSADAHAILAAACLARPVGRIFPYSYHVANDRLRKALVAAGLYKRGRSWHIFRHANGDLRDEAGHSLRSQSAQMGHGNNLAQTMRYGSAGDVDADALDRVRHGLSAA